MKSEIIIMSHPMLKDIINVTPPSDYFIQVTFETGETKNFDVKVLFVRSHWKELLDYELFNVVYIFRDTVT